MECRDVWCLQGIESRKEVWGCVGNFSNDGVNSNFKRPKNTIEMSTKSTLNDLE